MRFAGHIKQSQVYSLDGQQPVFVKVLVEGSLPSRPVM